jgi:hypothetical protein
MRHAAVTALSLLVAVATGPASADTITDWNQTAIAVMKAANVGGNPVVAHLGDCPRRYVRRGQRAPHLEATEVPGARHDHSLDGVAGELVAGPRILAGLPAHLRLRGK